MASLLQDAEAHIALTVNDLPFLLDIFRSIVYNLEQNCLLRKEYSP